MSIEIKVPTLGESVTEATVGKWFKKPGDPIRADEPLCELETDKVTVEVPAPAAGVLAEIVVAEGVTAAVGAVLGVIREGAAAPAPSAARPAAPKPVPAAAAVQSSPTRAPVRADRAPSPSARKIMSEQGLSADAVQGSGRGGQVLKEDVVSGGRGGRSATPAAIPAQDHQEVIAPGPAAYTSLVPSPAAATALRVPSPPNDAAREERVKMTRLRQTIARRLKDAQNTAAMLTTFNDVDMSAIMKLRGEYKELFEKRYGGVRLGFMGFFVKACIQALRDVPAVNAEIDGTDIVYKNYYHIGVAVGTDKGLVVPVVREADSMSLAEVEGTISDYGRRARDGKLAIEDMQGGTFTITNGGVYGSLLSTPILNAPQSGILGMHRIEERPVVRGGQIVIRPMMYLALSYDHRIVDGKEAVTFLVRVKECLEDPQRLVLEL